MRNLFLLLSLALFSVASTTLGDVIVIGNRTGQRAEVRLLESGKLPRTLRLEVDECRPIYTDNDVSAITGTGVDTQPIPLRRQSAYLLANSRDGQPQLVRLGIGDESAQPPQRKLPGTAQAPMAVITVKLLVDDEEPWRRSIWEQRLRDRIAAASKILERHAGVGLRVVAVDTWESDDATNDFGETLRAFERRVSPAPAQLAIGFSSQYELVKGRVHLGGTRGPLRSHILMREWSKIVTESERLELLVHELGHLLGAVHSPEADSVMRPVLGDRKARRADYRIRFDPLNTLVIAMTGEEIRRRRIASLTALIPTTKRRLVEIYTTLDEAQTDDRTARMMISHLAFNPNLPRRAVDTPGSVKPVDAEAAQVRSVIQAVTTAARKNRAASQPLADDELFRHYVQTALRAGQKLPNDKRALSTITGLVLALDLKREFKGIATLRDMSNRSDSVADRSVRSAFIGKPTIGGRSDLAKHWLISAYVATAQGPNAAEALGEAKEMFDTRKGGSGFSFADLAADYAGIAFANALKSNHSDLDAYAEQINEGPLIPNISDSPAPLSLDEFNTQFGGLTDARYQQAKKRIKDAAASLSAYRLNKH